MKRGLWLLLVMNFWLLLGCSAATSTAATDLPPTPTAVNTKLAADFQLATLNGEAMRLSDLRGRYVLINFWATWCPPCRAEMPYFQQLAETHADRLTIVAVNMRENIAEIQPFVAKTGVTFPILLYPDDQTLLQYDVRALPASFVVAPSGEVILHQVGQVDPEAFDGWLATHLQP